MKTPRVALILALSCAATSAHAAPTFTVVTTESGVQALRDAKPSDWWMSGLSFIDLDHDGDLDLYLSDHHGEALAAINDGTGKFTLAGGSYPTSEIHIPHDIDEDGKVDMDVTYADGGAKWWFNKTAVGSSTLEFDDVGDVDTREGNESRSEALVDINRDGKIDWVRSCQGQNFKIDFGDGAGKFAKDSALVPQPEGNALDAGIMFADLDGDGDEDMIINWGGYSSPGGDDYGRVRVLMNDGQANFVEKTTEIGLKTDHLAILGAGDVDQDGDVDLIGLDDRNFPEAIYVNDGQGSFTPLANAVTGVSGAAEYALWGLATVTDLDNDGIADILIDGRFFFHVLHGTGGGHFVYQNDAWGGITHTAEGSVDGGFAFGDIDADGDLDLMGFTAGDPDRQVALYRNDLPAQHWLNVRPVGLPGGNKGAVNSKIRIYEADADHLLWFEEVLAFSKQAQQNYYAFDATERHYGLGDRTTVDVEITFYPSGTVVRKNGAAADTTLLLGEDGTNGTIDPTSSSASSGAGSTSSGMGPPDSGSPLPGSGGGSGASSADADTAEGCGCRVGADRTRGEEHCALALLLGLLVLVRQRGRALRSRAARR